ncbi:MAG: hypothetical protein DRQ54_09650, partial [Gammaproteobacteria bacterium]
MGSESKISNSGLIIFLLALVTLYSAAAYSAATPDDLSAWEPWVAERHPDLACPFLFNDNSQRVCAWPGRLELAVDDGGFNFRHSWQVYAQSWVPLPGNQKYWPVLKSSAMGPSAANLLVSERKKRPVVGLPAGKYLLQGRVNWQRQPEFIDLPGGSGLVSLSVDGEQQAHPQ